jgi:hypothetical protein
MPSSAAGSSSSNYTSNFTGHYGNPQVRPCLADEQVLRFAMPSKSRRSSNSNSGDMLDLSVAHGLRFGKVCAPKIETHTASKASEQANKVLQQMKPACNTGASYDRNASYHGGCPVDVPPGSSVGATVPWWGVCLSKSFFNDTTMDTTIDTTNSRTDDVQRPEVPRTAAREHAARDLSVGPGMNYHCFLACDLRTNSSTACPEGALCIGGQLRQSMQGLCVYPEPLTA